MSFHKDTVTIYDVARRAGVSAATVSRVINNRENVKEATRERVQKAIRESRFSPNQIARTLPMRTSRTIGLVAESLFTPYFSRFSHELDRACAARGYALIIGLTGSEQGRSQKEIQVLQDFLKRQVDGFVLLGGESNRARISQSFRQEVEEIQDQVPVVFVNCGFSFEESSHVRTDEKEAFSRVMDHLIGLGHRKIGLITGTGETWTSDVKRSVYFQKMEEASLTCDENFIRSGNYSVESGREQAAALLQAHKGMSAIACANDILAVGALQGALSLGLSVPEDLSLTGFDNIDLAQYAVPGITTIAQNYTALAEEAFDIILNGGDGKIPSRQVSLEGELIVRGSTSPFEGKPTSS
ncbi:MAG: LacI family DNA-binding transcriptional regulator [Spirochaetales bacterium]|nr:LacI family DNA-binding transcriptional regulator [Spirochaetales bacterium]